MRCGNVLIIAIQSCISRHHSTGCSVRILSSCCFSTNLKCESHRLRTHTDRGGRISHQPEVNECAHENRSSDRFEPASPHARRSSRPARHRSGGWQSRRAAQTSLHYAHRDALGDRASYPSPSELSFGTSRSKALTTGQSADPEQAGHGEFLDGNTQNKRRGEEGSARGSAEHKGAGSATLRWIIWITRPPAAGGRSQYINTSTRVRAGGMPTVSDHRDQIAQITVTSIQPPPPSALWRPQARSSLYFWLARPSSGRRGGDAHGRARMAWRGWGGMSETDAAQAPSRTAATHGARRKPSAKRLAQIPHAAAAPRVPRRYTHAGPGPTHLPRRPRADRLGWPIAAGPPGQVATVKLCTVPPPQFARAPEQGKSGVAASPHCRGLFAN